MKSMKSIMLVLMAIAMIATMNTASAGITDGELREMKKLDMYGDTLYLNGNPATLDDVYEEWYESHPDGRPSYDIRREDGEPKYKKQLREQAGSPQKPEQTESTWDIEGYDDTSVYAYHGSHRDSNIQDNTNSRITFYNNVNYGVWVNNNVNCQIRVINPGTGVITEGINPGSTVTIE